MQKYGVEKFKGVEPSKYFTFSRILFCKEMEKVISKKIINHY